MLNNSSVENKLTTLGIKLETSKPPVANYLGTKRVGDLLYVSARVSELCGVVGEGITEEQAKMASRDTIVLLLAIIKKDVDLDSIAGVVKLQGFIRSSPTFIRQPQVLDGASELLIELFGENGKHSRTATGVNQLPSGAVVQLDMILQLKPK